MIAVKPDNEAGRVLAAVVAAPGELDAEAIGVMLWPAPSLPTPPLQWSGPSQASTAYRAWLQSLSGKQQTLALWRDRHAARASRHLTRLQEAGLIEKMRPPMLSVWWQGLVVELGPERAFQRVMEAELQDHFSEEEDRDTPDTSEAYTELLGNVRGLIEKVGKGPRNTRDVLGLNPSGAEKQAYSRLVNLGIVIPSAYRWPTQAGIDRVASWGSAR